MLLKLPHVRQQQQADCLAACAAMALSHLKVTLSYARILQLLGTSAAGTPFHRLERLQAVGVTVMRGEGSIALLRQYITAQLPVIVDVYSAELPYWQTRVDIAEHERATAHAVVVVGFEDQTLFVHDPDLEQALHAVDVGDFELAWLVRDYRYAVLQK
jgi:ABC-type bacteriocin/lantibiotic exporter with double-glycine peptidase domain